MSKSETNISDCIQGYYRPNLTGCFVDEAVIGWWRPERKEWTDSAWRQVWFPTNIRKNFTT